MVFQSGCTWRPLLASANIWIKDFFTGIKNIAYSDALDDQTQVDSKSVGQPEHASLNQCQLIAANRPKIGALVHPQLVVEIRFLSNVIDARALIGPCSHVTSR